jgi:hypothetical protein
MFVYENLRTAILKSVFLISTVLLYAVSNTRGEALKLYEGMQTSAGCVW